MYIVTLWIDTDLKVKALYKWTGSSTIVYYKRLASRVSHDSFNPYVGLLFFSKQCTYCKTNAIYTWGNYIRFLERRFLNLLHEYRNVNGTL